VSRAIPALLIFVALALVGCGGPRQAAAPIPAVNNAVAQTNPQLELAAGVLNQFGEPRKSLELGQQVVMGTSACKPGHTCFSCFQCHGISGEGSPIAAIPRLAGQDARYLSDSLRRFARGERASATMQQVALALTDEQIEQVSGYFAALTTPAARVPVAAAERDAAEALGKQIEEKGLPDQGVPACVACHGSAARKANPIYPNIKGQYADYMIAQFKSFRDGTRKDPNAALMVPVARGLKPDQERAVAIYYSLRSPEPAITPSTPQSRTAAATAHD
jgi:cytochrome c553